MMQLTSLIRRNTKLFFKDKGLFFTSLITPLILIVLYATFLKDVYYNSFVSSIPDGFNISKDIIDACVGGQLISSILSVSCVTVAFCSNMLMVQDKANRTINDLTITPVRPTVLSLSYYLSTLISTLIICFTALALCLGYVAVTGWYLSGLDVMLLVADVFILTGFGTALSSIINFFLSTQGQISAVGSIVSSGYGFICGAYMPISQFSEGLQRIIMFLPGTYATALTRNHAMRGALAALENENIPSELISTFEEIFDCTLYFFDHKVETQHMYIVLISSVLALLGIYVLINILKLKKAK